MQSLCVTCGGQVEKVCSATVNCASDWGNRNSGFRLFQMQRAITLKFLGLVAVG